MGCISGCSFGVVIGDVKKVMLCVGMLFKGMYYELGGVYK